MSCYVLSCNKLILCSTDACLNFSISGKKFPYGSPGVVVSVNGPVAKSVTVTARRAAC